MGRKRKIIASSLLVAGITAFGATQEYGYPAASRCSPRHEGISRIDCTPKYILFGLGSVATGIASVFPQKESSETKTARDVSVTTSSTRIVASSSNSIIPKVPTTLAPGVNPPPTVPSMPEKAKPASMVVPGSIYVLGDSLTSGMEAAGLEASLKAKGWKNVVIAGKACRMLLWDTPAFDVCGGGLNARAQIEQPADVQAIKQAQVVYVEIGTNDSAKDPKTFRASAVDEAKAIHSINPDAAVIWQNVYLPGKGDNYKAINWAISDGQAAGSYAVADYAAAAQPALYGADGSHPSDYNPMIEFVLRAVGSPQ